MRLDLHNGLLSPFFRGGIDTMMELATWYSETSADSPAGFFQIAGGIASDFPICVVLMLPQDLKRETSVRLYFCQIRDATTSSGGYSGAIPNEKTALANWPACADQ